MKNRIVITRQIFTETIDYLKEYFDVVSNQSDRENPPKIFKELQFATGLQTSTVDRVNEAFLDRCPELKIVSNTAVGFNNIDVGACTERGILVTNTPGVLDESVADYAMGLIIAACRRLTESERYLRAGLWRGVSLTKMLGRDVNGANLGLVGFGRIGQAIAKRAQAFEMKIFYHARNQVRPEVEQNLAAVFLSLDKLLAVSDIVLLIVPYKKDTHHLIAAKELSKMRPDAVLINMARGGVIDDGALIDFLKANEKFYAALDVYENEPIIDENFLKLKNVLLSPHMGSATVVARKRMANMAAKNLVSALHNGQPMNVVNPSYIKNIK